MSSPELRVGQDETNSVVVGDYISKVMVGRRREQGQEPKEKPWRLGIFKGLCKAAHKWGSHSDRWAPSRPGRIELAPTLAGVEVPALTRQPASQLGKLN